MPAELTNEQVARATWIKWWFDFIERFLMVGALGAAANVTEASWLVFLFVISICMLAMWIDESFKQFVWRHFPREPSPDRFQRFEKALLHVVRGLIFASFTVGGSITILGTTFDLVEALSGK